MGNQTGREALVKQTAGDWRSRRLETLMDTAGSHPPLLFHPVCGENVRLFADGREARRVESFCKGLAMSARAVAVDETVCMHFSDMATNWSGVLRFGVTNCDPQTLGADLPKFVCPDMTGRQPADTWAKALAEKYCQKNTVLHFYVRDNGDLYYGVNGVLKGLFLSGINTTLPLWVIVDIYGNSTAVEFMDPADVRFQSSRGSRRSNSVVAPPPPPPPPQAAVVADASSSVARPSPPAAARSDRDLLADDNQLPSLRHFAGMTFAPLEWHAVRGRNMRLNSDKTMAVRCDSEYAAGYVFTSRPVRLHEKLVVQVVRTFDEYEGGLAFGLTSCDPLHVRAHLLPDDSDDLLERAEYWVGIKDVAARPRLADELAFQVDDQGRVHFYRNSESSRVILHVDQTQSLWMYFDVYGNTQGIRLLGTLSGSEPSQPRRVRLPPDAPVAPARRSAGVSGAKSRPPPPPPPRPAPRPSAAAAAAAAAAASAGGAAEECLVCMTAPVECALYKCGHMCMCLSCANAQRDTKGTCPCCREPILDILRTFRTGAN